MSSEFAKAEYGARIRDTKETRLDYMHRAQDGNIYAVSIKITAETTPGAETRNNTDITCTISSERGAHVLHPGFTNTILFDGVSSEDDLWKREQVAFKEVAGLIEANITDPDWPRFYAAEGAQGFLKGFPTEPISGD